MSVQLIEPVIRDYAWGSRTALARLAGREKAEQPEAELWVGAHEGSPAYLPALDCTLDEHIASAPRARLGGAHEAFGGRLPFLLKILAAEKPLSIQAHPDARRAAEAADGVYGDSWPKPEAWVPLEPCQAFIGSLPFDTAASRLRSLGVAQLDELVAQAQGAPDKAHALLDAILHVSSDARAELVGSVVAALQARTSSQESPQEGDVAAAQRCILRVHDHFPGDIGVVVLLTMVHRDLKPGVSCFLPAGVLHTFVQGTAVEILANSDNVVRAGLTEKAIDVEELLAIVDVEADAAPEEPAGEGPILTYPSRTEHFALDEIRVGPHAINVPHTGQPRVALVVEGSLEVMCSGTTLKLGPLEALWLAADDPAAVVTSQSGARLFVASPGSRSEVDAA